MSNVVQVPGQTPLYRRDYYAWALEQARALQERRFEALDFEHLAEEVEDLAKSERRELRSRLRQVLVDLLKFHLQSGRRSRSWEGTLASQRAEIAGCFMTVRAWSGNCLRSSNRRTALRCGWPGKRCG